MAKKSKKTSAPVAPPASSPTPTTDEPPMPQMQVVEGKMGVDGLLPVAPQKAALPPGQVPTQPPVEVKQLQGAAGVQAVEVGGIRAAQAPAGHAYAQTGKNLNQSNPTLPEKIPAVRMPKANPTAPSATAPPVIPTLASPVRGGDDIEEPVTGGAQIETIVEKLSRVDPDRAIRAVVMPSSLFGTSRWSPAFRAKVVAEVGEKLQDTELLCTLFRDVLVPINSTWATLRACRALVWLITGQVLFSQAAYSDPFDDTPDDHPGAAEN